MLSGLPIGVGVGRARVVRVDRPPTLLREET
jgi:hypothetical protein